MDMDLLQLGQMLQTFSMVIIPLTVQDFDYTCKLYNSIVGVYVVVCYIQSVIRLICSRHKLVNCCYAILVFFFLLVGAIIIQKSMEDRRAFLYVIVSAAVWNYSSCDRVLQNIFNFLKDISIDVTDTDIFWCMLVIFISINTLPGSLLSTVNKFVMKCEIIETVVTWDILCKFYIGSLAYIKHYGHQKNSVLSWRHYIKTYYQTGLMFAAASFSLFAVHQNTEQVLCKRPQNKHEVSDLLLLCINYHDFFNFTCKHLLVLAENKVKRISKIIRLYYDWKKFFKYCMVVFTSSGAFISCLLFSSTYISTWVDPSGVVTYVNNITEFRLYGNFNNTYYYNRHLNEDIQFNCRIHVKKSNEMFDNVYWYRNDTIIDLSHSDRVELNDDNTMLTIHFINSSDFGVYSCFVNGEHINTFLLKQTEEPSSKYYYIDRGSFLYFETDIFTTLGDIYDISVEYTVNGIDVHDLCNSAIFSCSPLSLIVNELRKTPFENIIHVFHKTDATYLFFNVNLITCVCGNMYGLHEIKICKEYYNRTTGNNVIVESDFPIKYYFFPKDNDSTVYDELYQSNLPYHYIQRMFNKTDEVIIPSVFWIPQITLHVAFIVNNVVFVVLSIVLYLLMRLLAHLLTLYCRITIVPFRDKILFGYYFVPCLPPADKPLAGIENNYTLQYDVYVSSCDEDNDKALSLVTFLEKECGFKVCFPVRDLADEGNCSYFHSFTKATEQCRMFIVVLSRDYLEDDMCNNVQLMSCIMPLIHSSRRQARDLVILKLDRDIDIPIQISFYPDVTIINYTSDNDEIEIKRKLGRILVTERFS
ncbi:hypothetical protein ACF0H5_000450 [Mactra antiquata]